MNQPDDLPSVMPIQSDPTRSGDTDAGSASPPSPPKKKKKKEESRGCFLPCLILVLLVGGGLAVLAVLATMVGISGGSDSTSTGLIEKFHSGKSSASEKIAIIRIDGVLMEGMTSYFEKQIDQAASDKKVKAIVVRVNSPGGSVTASDMLHNKLVKLRDGNTEKSYDPKPIVVSMGNLAASGGYYIAMPAKEIVAEKTTLTGSIGVYASLPNVEKMSEKVGFSMKIIKAGEVKASGSPFLQMTPKEEQHWQNMVDHMYLGFLKIVEDGRPTLKGKFQETITINETLPVRTEKGKENVYKIERYRADGGIFTADQAKEFGLVDQIGYLEDALQRAKALAGISTFRAVTYDKPITLFSALSGAEAKQAGLANVLDPAHLSQAALPRVWYLAPQSEFAGVLSTLANKD